MQSNQRRPHLAGTKRPVSRFESLGRRADDLTPS